MNQLTIGQRLSQAREANRASLYQASQDTKIRVDFLQCLEEDEFNFVSGAPYVRGMLRSYARWLGIDESSMIRDFDSMYGTEPEALITEMISKPTNVGPRPRRPQWLLAGMGAAAILLILSLVGLMNPDGDVATPPPNPVESQAQADATSPTNAPDTFAQATPMQGVNVLVSVIGEKAWMEVHADGNEAKAIFKGMLNSGQTQTFTATNRVKLLIGDLGAVRLSLNGKDLGTPGQPGQVGTREFTLESANLAGG
jgi:cytoskeletal protein RodZ